MLFMRCRPQKIHIHKEKQTFILVRRRWYHKMLSWFRSDKSCDFKFLTEVNLKTTILLDKNSGQLVFFPTPVDATSSDGVVTQNIKIRGSERGLEIEYSGDDVL